MNGQVRRVIIVTGASRGLGRDMALHFGMMGDRVVVNYREREEDALSVVQDITRNGSEALAVRADVRKGGEVEAMVKSTIDRWGAVDVLVNNAGIARDGLTIRMPDDAWDDVIETNLKGPFLCIRAAAKVMMKQHSGHIISVSSISGMQGRAGQANYAASKSGLLGLTRAAAKELGRFNIRVNAVLPGHLTTDMGKALTEETARGILNANTLGRTSDSREISAFIHHLSLMQNVSGQVFNLDSRVL
ncbi:MAG: SDR family NAD(P)-dependent oxidoreductase [Nitrospirota bacterium]